MCIALLLNQQLFGQQWRWHHSWCYVKCLYWSLKKPCGAYVHIMCGRKNENYSVKPQNHKNRRIHKSYWSSVVKLKNRLIFFLNLHGVLIFVIFLQTNGYGMESVCNAMCTRTQTYIYIYMIEKWWYIDVFGGYLSCLPSNSSCCLCGCVSVWRSTRNPTNEHKNSIKSIISIWLDGCCSFLPHFLFEFYFRQINCRNWYRFGCFLLFKINTDVPNDPI